MPRRQSQIHQIYIKGTRSILSHDSTTGINKHNRLLKILKKKCAYKFQQEETLSNRQM